MRKISKANYKNLVFIISIIKCFSNHANITKMTRAGDASSGLASSRAARMTEYGKEYFQGNKNELLSEILQIVKNYNN